MKTCSTSARPAKRLGREYENEEAVTKKIPFLRISGLTLHWNQAGGILNHYQGLPVFQVSTNRFQFKSPEQEVHLKLNSL
jgi:hypothetical protein